MAKVPFELFDARARRVVVMARDSARDLRHDFIGTEHLLLGILTDGTGVASDVLNSFRVLRAAARDEIVRAIGWYDRYLEGHIPFTPGAKRTLELAAREAEELGHGYIGAEHLLLALVDNGQDLGLATLIALGSDPSTIRGQVLERLCSLTRVRA